MPIIFGIRRKAYRLATVFAVCRVCSSTAAQAIVKVRAFFTLFFVPLVPLNSTYRVTCTLCGQTSKVTKDEADQAVAHASAVAQAAEPAPNFPPPAASFPPPATSFPPPVPPLESPAAPMGEQPQS